MARTPPGRTSLAMVANRWMASMSRCVMDTTGSTTPVSHKTARADPFVPGFANSPWTAPNHCDRRSRNRRRRENSANRATCATSESSGMRKCYRMPDAASVRARRGWPLDAIATKLPQTREDWAHIRRQIAHHEGGHCVAAAVLGLEYFSIAFDADGGGSFNPLPPGNGGRMTSDQIEGAASQICRNWRPDNKRFAREKIIETLAGPAASFVFDRIWSGDTTDRRVANSLASTITSSDVERRKLLAEAQDDALALVRRQWTAVTALAKCLLASPRGKIERDEIIPILCAHGLAEDRMIVRAGDAVIGEVVVNRSGVEAFAWREGQTRSLGYFSDEMTAARAIPA